MGCGKGWFSIGNSEDAALGGSQGPAGPSGMPALVPVGNSCLVPLQLGLCPGFFRQSGASSLPWVCPESEEPQSPPHAQRVVSSCPAASQDRAFLYPLKILQGLGVAAADPGSLVAPGRTEPKHPSGRGSDAATQPSNRLGPRLLRNHGVFLEGCGMENCYLCSERLEISWGGSGAEAD